jgi:hypothetical protein
MITLQQNVIYTKLDMMQALNITIDYIDSDRDWLWISVQKGWIPIMPSTLAF